MFVVMSLIILKQRGGVIMKFNSQEINFLIDCLDKVSTFTIAKGEQIDYPGVKHEQLKQKLKDYHNKLHR